MDDRLTELRCDERHLLTRWRNVLMIGLRKMPTHAIALATGDAMYDLAQDNPKMVFLHLVRVRGKVEPPPDDVRGAYERIYRDRQSPACGSAIVIERAGFIGSLIRSVITGMTMMSRPSFPTRVFASLPEAAQWLHHRLSDGGWARATSLELEGTMADFERLFEQRVPPEHEES